MLKRYIGADEDEPLECDSDTIECEAVENDSDGDITDEVTIEPSEALKCSHRPPSFLSLHQDSDEMTKKLASINEHVKKSARC